MQRTHKQPAAPWAGVMMVVAIIVWLTAATPSGAQRALDNSLQVGQRTNAARNPASYQVRNELLYGNVSGLSQFRDTLGYGAPGDFRGSLGSDDLFRFRAQSFPAGSIASITGRASNPGATVVLRRPYSSTVNNYGTTGYAGVGQPLYTPVLDAGRSLPTTSGTRLDSYIARDQLGIRTRRDGASMRLRASPLIGVRWQTMGRTQTTPIPQDQLTAEPPARQRPTATPDPRRLIRPEVELEPTVPKYDPTSLDFGAALMPAQLDTAERLRVTSDPEQSLDQRLEQIKAKLFSPLGSRAYEPGTDVYLDLLKQIRDRREIARDERRPSMRPSDTLTGIDAESPADRYRAPGLIQPTDEQLEKAEQDRDEALQRLRDLNEQQLQRLRQMIRGRERVADDQERIPPPGEEKMSEELKRFIEKLDYEFDPLKTLAGASDRRATKLMERAEAALARERYFDAETLYRRAADQAPDQHLARVGLIHAQMGAGLVRTAAANLRRLLEEHPQLIAARYDAKLLPPPKRLRWIQQQLNDMIGAGQQADLPILLAYLGYQTGSDRLVRYGLLRAQAKSADDVLLPLLIRIWVSSETPSPPALPERQSPPQSPQPSDERGEPSAPESGSQDQPDRVEATK